MVVWLFVALVITQSYTASLTSLLTVQRLDPTTVDIETLKKTGAKVGCDGTSFVVKYLEEVLGFHPNNIKKIYLEDDYPEALTRGDIAAAFLEIPYVKVFLAKNCKGFITGPIFKVGGFGFVSTPYSFLLPLLINCGKKKYNCEFHVLFRFSQGVLPICLTFPKQFFKYLKVGN